ncbi:hypothetical protein MRX96_002340 [Rhipicephalus microplus]
MIPSIVHSGRGDQKAVTAASEWLCKHLQERAHWKDVLLSTQDSLLWCVSTHNHQELLGDYAGHLPGNNLVCLLAKVNQVVDQFLPLEKGGD